MENSFWNHTFGPTNNGQWPQAPQHPNLAWNPLASSLPQASYANSNYYASLQPSYDGRGLYLSSQQQRIASIPNRQTSSAYPRVDSASQPTPPIRPFRQGPGGPHRCAHSGCPWSGPTPKALEIHKMDRHLIFPPGWKPRKGVPDGEGGYASSRPSSSPLTSLLRPNMPIPGTGITLTTPEAIDAWIAERRKKWPSAARVEEKLKTQTEAIERGELIPENSRKRKRNDEGSYPQRRSSRGRGTAYAARGYIGQGRGRGRGRGRGGGRGDIAQSVAIPGPTLAPGSRPANPLPRPLVGHDPSSASDTESSNSDMDPIEDAISSKPPIPENVQLVSCDGSDITVGELDVSDTLKR